MKFRLLAKLQILTAAGLALVALATSPSLMAEQAVQAETSIGSAWKFRVFLDDKEIGYHHFYLAESGNTRQLKSVASFEYSLLFVRLYHYEHENNEIWNGNCLQSIDSRTDANGEPFRVNGRRSDGEFRLFADSGEESLPECVMSFAYWNPAFLEQTSLLNTQDGEFLKVEFSDPVLEDLELDGGQRPSYRYHLVAGDLKLDLWYSVDREWLALESEVTGGRKLRYILEDGSEMQASEYRLGEMSPLADSGSAFSRRGW